jgi:ATP-dependent exoDNAse (exonuclease V) beta subunit
MRSVILDAEDHDARHFYVAATRPAETLTICSGEPRIRFAT